MKPEPEPEPAPEPCARLRTKMMYVAGRNAAPLDGTSTTACYWCLDTMSPVGPDDAPVRPEACRPGRPCHRA